MKVTYFRNTQRGGNVVSILYRLITNISVKNSLQTIIFINQLFSTGNGIVSCKLVCSHCEFLTDNFNIESTIESSALTQENHALMDRSLLLPSNTISTHWTATNSLSFCHSSRMFWFSTNDILTTFSAGWVIVFLSIEAKRDVWIVRHINQSSISI